MAPRASTPKALSTRTLFGLALLVLPFLMAGCGPRAVDWTVVMRDYKFDPAVFEVAAGAQVTLTAVNRGHHDHYWAVLEKGYGFTLPFNDDDVSHILALVTADVGNQDTITFTAPSVPGEYVVICSIPGHAEKGMLGSLIVK